LARVQDADTKWGFIDKTGELVIPCKWGWAEKFSEGLAQVMGEGDKWGYIDKTGKLVIPCKWEWAEKFTDGLARVQDEDTKWGFINKTGELVNTCSCVRRLPPKKDKTRRRKLRASCKHYTKICRKCAKICN
jgi:hypothetical protein